MEDYINIAGRIFSGTRYNALAEDVKRGSSGSCILVPGVFLPVYCFSQFVAQCNISFDNNQKTVEL